MGNTSGTICRPCPDCGDEVNCICPNGLSDECSHTYSSSQCVTGTLEDAHALQVSTETSTFTRKRDSLDQTINDLNDEISRLETERDANGTQIANLKHILNTSIKNYAAGLNWCMNVSLVEAKHKAETCESSNKAPSLQRRNETCNHLSDSLDKRSQLQGNGWAQCQCPNGTLGDDHSICAPGWTNCSACDSGYWMKLGAFNKCNKVKTCNTNQYETVSPTATRDRQCANLTTCGTNQYQTVAPTYNRNRQCANLRVCTSSEYETVAPTFNRDRQCAPLRVCSSAEYETVSPTPYRNRQCAVKQCVCDNGSSRGINFNYGILSSCEQLRTDIGPYKGSGNGGYMVHACNKGYADPALNCSGVSNLSYGQTACDWGKELAKADKTPCPYNGENVCTACNPGYYMGDNNRCTPWEGSCRMGSLKPQHERVGPDDCGRCYDGYSLRPHRTYATYQCVFDMSNWNYGR